MAEARRPRDPERTKAEMVEAALQTLRSEGFVGTTARAIAERGGFNQALIFYHFGGVNQLLLAALDASSAERMERYRAALAKTTTLDGLIRAAARLYREDVDGGHVTIVSVLTGASLAHPELAPAVTERMKPWLE